MDLKNISIYTKYNKENIIFERTVFTQRAIEVLNTSVSKFSSLFQVCILTIFLTIMHISKTTKSWAFSDNSIYIRSDIHYKIHIKLSLILTQAQKFHTALPYKGTEFFLLLYP